MHIWAIVSDENDKFLKIGVTKISLLENSNTSKNSTNKCIMAKVSVVVTFSFVSFRRLYSEMFQKNGF